jgi:hypothetical protein
MGMKSRGNFAVEGCIGCLDIGSDRCKECLGRPQDKRGRNEKERYEGTEEAS